MTETYENEKIIKNTNAEILFSNEWMSKENFESFVDRKVKIDNNTETSIRKCIEFCTSPAKEDIFNTFKIGKPEDVRVLILGQDPYPKKGRAHGYAFSFGDKRPAEDSLLNIFKAVKVYQYKEKNIIKEFKDIKPNEVNWNTNLATWANNNGILLLNTALTYVKGGKTEHQNKWKDFIEYVIEKILTTGEKKLVVFLWGDDARVLFHRVIFSEKDKKDKTANIKRKLLVLSTSHPSENHNAFKKGFCYEAPNHFKACDEFLKEPVWENLWKYINPENKV